MAPNETKQMFDKSEMASIMYEAFSRALEDNDIKFNQKNKLEDALVKEFSKFTKVADKEMAMIKEALANGSKKGNSVQGELVNLFKNLERAINNKEYKRGSVSSAYPKTEKIFNNKEQSIKKSALSRFNRLNDKLVRVVDEVSKNVDKLSDTTSNISGLARRIDSITNILVEKSTKMDGSVSWLENATSNISKSTDKASRLTQSLVGQSMKIDKESSWVESAVDNLRKSSGRLKGTFRKGYDALDKNNGSSENGESEKKQEEDGFIGRLVKKLETSKLGRGLGSDILRFGGALLASKLYNIPKVGHAAATGAFLWGATGFRGASKVASTTGKVISKGIVGSRLGNKATYGLIGKLAQSEKTLPLAEKLMNFASVTKVGGVASKLLPGIGAAAFGIDSAMRYKKGDALGGTISAVGGVGSAMSATGIGAVVGEPLSLIAMLLNVAIDNIKPIGRAVTGLFELFRPIGQFVTTVFGGLAKWLTDTFGHKGSGGGSGGGFRQSVSNAFDDFKSQYQTGPIKAGALSKGDLISKVRNNKSYDSISKGGKGWSVSHNDFIGDVEYAKHGTNEILDSLGLSGLVVTSALGSKQSGHAGKLTSTGHYSGTKLDFGKAGGMSKAEADKLVGQLKATGKFAMGNGSTWAEADGNGKYHVDATIKKSEYDKIAAREKAEEEAKAARTTPFSKPQQLPPMLSSGTSPDYTGNQGAQDTIMQLNHNGRF